MILNNLFNYLQAFPEPNQTQNKSYILIPTRDKLESHIRIDARFAPDHPYLPFAHYTVIVNRRHVHIGFHNNGTIEAFPASREFIDEEILSYAESAHLQLNTLIKKFNEKLNNLDTEYTKQESFLSMSDDMASRSDLFKDCCAILKARSQLLSEQDPRLTILQSMRSYFMREEPIAAPPATSTPLAEAPVTADLTTEALSLPQTSSDSKPTSISYDQECADIITKLKKSTILQTHHLLQKLEALIGCHKVTSCLSKKNLEDAQKAVQGLLTHEELAIKLLPSHPELACTYAMSANPVKVFTKLFTDTSITTEQIFTMVRHLCSRSAIYNYLITNFYFSDPSFQNSAPLFYSVLKRQQDSKDKMKLIDFMLARPLSAGCIFNGKTILFINILASLAQGSLEYTAVLAKVLESAHFSTESGPIVANISGNISQGEKLLPKDLKIFDTVENTSSLGRHETFYRHLPIQTHTKFRIIELAANRANFSELVILLTQAAYFNPNIMTRFACGMEAVTKGNIGLAVGHDAIGQYQRSKNNYRMITLFSEINHTAVLESIPHIISKMGSLLTNSKNKLALIQSSYETLEDYQTQQHREKQLSILPAIAMNLCAQIALSLTPSANIEQLYFWATRYEKPLVTLALFGSFDEMMQKIKRTITQMLILKVDHPSFEAEHQTRLRMVVSAALKKDKTKAKQVFTTIQDAIVPVNAIVSPSDTAVINEVARKCLSP